MTKEISRSHTPECWFQKSGKCPVNGCSWDAYVKSSPGNEMGGNTNCIEQNKIPASNSATPTYGEKIENGGNQ